MSWQLRGGYTAEDPRLGRVPEFDPLSRNFPARGTLWEVGAGIEPRYWRCDVRLDQGNYPRCVGYAWTTDVAADPKRRRVDDALAVKWYDFAQRNDQWYGEHYAGSSTLGGAKAAVLLGYASAYYWHFSVEDVARTVANYGPVLTGTNWYRRMSDPDPDGRVRLEGPLDGGHEWCIRAVDPRNERFIARQTWGLAWGKRGDFYVTWDDYARLLREDGDACSPERI